MSQCIHSTEAVEPDTLETQESKMRTQIFLTVLVSAFVAVGALENGLARTPPMGFSTWTSFGCDINSEDIRKTADSIVAKGLDKLGYKYIQIDDCWSVKEGRDKDGKLMADPKKFPEGMKALAQYVHDKGLYLGIYSDVGVKTCGGYPGSYGHECVDAQTWADWGIDYLKLDYCYTPEEGGSVLYPRMRDCLKNTGRDILFGMCSWGVDQPWLYGKDTANMWRFSADLQATWDSIMRTADNIAGLSKYTQKGAWNDPDELQVGKTSLTEDEWRSHMNLWVITNSPLIIGHPVDQLTGEALAILSNKDVIDINQDSLGSSGDRVWEADRSSLYWTEVWAKPLADGSYAVVLFNRGSWAETTVQLQWSMIGLDDNIKATVHDVWANKDLGSFTGSFESGQLAGRASLLIRVTPVHSLRSEILI